MVLTILLYCVLIAAGEFPAKKGPINDYANIISASTKEKLSAIAVEIEQKSGFALVIATVNPDEDVDIEDYANRLYENWGVGKKDKNEGALLLFLPAQRRVRIEVGYGAEEFLTDAVTSQIINERIIPAVRANGLEEGVLSGTLAIASIVVQHYDISLSGPIVQRNYGNSREGETLPLPAIIVMLILLAIAVSTRTGRSILLGMLLSRAMGGGGRIGSSGFGGRIGSGGFGGGFGGFGGGRSGGGGASGRW